MKNNEQKQRDCCPICGHQFDEIRPINICPNHRNDNEWEPDELITEDDDYAWCY